MARITFETLSFTKQKDDLKVTLLKLFSSTIPREELESLGEYEFIDAHTLDLKEHNEDRAYEKFGMLLNRRLDTLTNNLTGNPVTYIHANSGIPLIGNVAFGIVYRESSIIEIKPVTSCNLDCVYCSISEGLSSTKHDFVVEETYLMQELKELLEFVDEPVEIHIGVQGEPFLYADIELLFKDLQELEQVHTISIDTNATLLSKERIDRIKQFTKLQLNLSLDAIDEEAAKRIAGTKNYNIEHVKKMIDYASQHLKVIVAPVFTHGYNNDEMEKIIQWIKTLKKQPILGIQNYLRYKTGRSISKELSWDEFYAMLDRLEEKYDIKLRLSKEDFNIRKIKPLPKPFKVGDVIKATIKSQDRFPNSVIAVAQNRNISVPGAPFKREKQIKVQITRDKHNVFTGKLVK